jgi:hypothetical protein
MGWSFVGVGQPRRGFWTNDSVLEVWLRFLALHVVEPTESCTLAAKIRDQWLLASRGYFHGSIPNGIEEAIATQQGETIVRDAIHSLLNALKTAPSKLSKDTLNIMGMADGMFCDDLSTWRLREVGNAFLDLLDGKITDGPELSVLTPGTGMIGPHETDNHAAPDE